MRPSRVVQTCAKWALKVLPVALALDHFRPHLRGEHGFNDVRISARLVETAHGYHVFPFAWRFHRARHFSFLPRFEIPCMRPFLVESCLLRLFQTINDSPSKCFAQ